MATFIIAEAGVNHNGSVAMGRQLIDVAARSGADAVKFQSFRAGELASPAAPKAEYQMRTSGGEESQYEMLRRLELSADAHLELIAHAASVGIEFLSTPFDLLSLQLLTERFGLRTIKVPSGEITNAPFLIEVARRAERIILSTGMSVLAEVDRALAYLAFGFASPAGAVPNSDSIEQAYFSASGRQALKERITLLHCTTEYPAPVDEVNLRAMDTLAVAFGLPTGYSDHSVGIHIPIAAVARGAVVIEKHFTLDRDLPGPDHRASLEPDELMAMVSAIRDVERSLGDGIKRPSESERKNRAIARKSLVVARDTAPGEPLELACRRPGSGVPPAEYWARAGQPAARSYAAGELLDP